MKEQILNEIKKIAFFLQHSGMFDSFSSRMRTDLESMPAEWATVETDGEIELSPGNVHWKVAELKGKLKEKDLYLKIDKSPDRNIYTLVYDNKTYKTSSMAKLKSIMDSLYSGEIPKPKYLQTIYNLLSRRKNELRDFIVKHYLKGLPQNWEVAVSKDVSRIYFKMTLENQTPSEIIDALKEKNFFRVNAIGAYFQHLLKKSDIDPADFVIKQRLLRVGDTAGFTISIK